MPVPELITTRQAARELKVSPAKILAWIRSGELEAIDLSSPGTTKLRYRISRDALLSFLKARSARDRKRPVARYRKPTGIPQYV